MKSVKHYVADTSVIVDGRVLTFIEQQEGSGEQNDETTVYVPRAVVAELEHQADLGLGIGYTGFDVLKTLKSKVHVVVEGARPTAQEVMHAKDMGTIDNLVRETAKQLGAVLITGDVVQHLVCEVEGIPSIYIQPKKDVQELLIKQFFTPDTMSIHLKEGACPKAKRGRPGRFKLVEIGEEELTGAQMRAFADNIREVVKQTRDGHYEISKKGMEVVQVGEYRVVITYPPFSDGMEITVARPMVHLTIDDYELSARLRERLEKKAEGIVVCGKPGSGKTTFASALALLYASKGKVVKTLENPRDLTVSKDITQYCPIEGDVESAKDILLLVRPDYTIYDEVRTSQDFQFYADLRMTGIGLVGIVHANSAIDAIHRFLTKIDLGLIPQIVDTVVFIENGGIAKTYNLTLRVKVPEGMRERDLARPVVEVVDFESGVREFEIYKFGDETVIAPIKAAQPPSIATHYFPKGTMKPTKRGWLLIVKRDDVHYNKKTLKKIKRELKKQNIVLKFV